MKLSLIIPVHNSAVYLKPLINSILDFIYDKNDVEVIFVNDNSSDDSVSIINEYMVDYNVKVIDSFGIGVSDARNTGIDAASGEYIHFIDSDDTIDVGNESDVYCKIQKHDNHDFILLEHFTVNGDRKFVSKSPFENDKSYTSEEFATISVRNGYLYSAVWRVFFKRSFIVKNKLRFKSGIYHEDVLFTTEAIIKSKVIKYMNIPIYNYFLRDNSITTSKCNVDKRLFSIMKIVDQLSFYRDEYVLLRLIYLLSSYAILSAKDVDSYLWFKSHVVKLAISKMDVKTKIRKWLMLKLPFIFFYFLSPIEFNVKMIKNGRI